MEEREMCLGIPGRIISMDTVNKTARVDFGDVVVTASTLATDGCSIDDYVLVHSGYILNRIDIDDAQETIRLLEELDRKQRGANGEDH